MHDLEEQNKRDTLHQYRHTNKLTSLQKSILSYMLDAKDLSNVNRDAKTFSKGTGYGNSGYFDVDG
jgi:hypothetical protein